MLSIQILPQQLNQAQLDSLYSKFIQLNAPELTAQPDQPVEISLEDRKCGFETVNDVKLNFYSFTPEQQNGMQSILSRPFLQTSIVSPSGFFRIHYDETGINRPTYVSGMTPTQNAMQVAEALDSVYRFEIEYLGYLSPPGDDVAGGDDKYDIYIQELFNNYYGYTEWENKVGPNNWTSFLVIDNDYQGFYSTGLNGMKVTVAHEFHHSIQLGSYSISEDNSPYRNDDVFFYEMSSTAMEEFVFDSVNDYYAYMQSYFSNPARAMPNQNGYNIAIWNMYLQENFGFGILKQQWELIPSIDAILAINNTIANRGSSFPREMNKFGIWTYYTNYRSIAGQYFEEAANYPIITPLESISYPQYSNVEVNSYSTANNFLKFNNSINGDTLFAIVTNGDAIQASENSNRQFLFDYTLYSDTLNGQRKLTNGYSSTFTANNLNHWSVSEILNNFLIRSDSVLYPIVEVNESLVFPNPFYYSMANGSGANINIVLNFQSGTKIDFNVYTSGLSEVFTSTETVGPLPNNSLGIQWDGLDDNNNKLGSGVYIYVIKQGDEVIKGKVVIFDE